MATTELDLKLLGEVAFHERIRDYAVSRLFYQVLGLSVLLMRSMSDARQEELVSGKDSPRFIYLVHHVLWLAKQGLHITTKEIVPQCGGWMWQDPRTVVMADKLRASFAHVCCHFNHQWASVERSRSRRSSLLSDSIIRIPCKRSLGLRDPVPSGVSESSFVTNPYAVGESHRATPQSPAQADGAPRLIRTTSHAERHLEQLESTEKAFAAAISRANDLLPGSDALRLSIHFEHCSFLENLNHDPRLAADRARAAIRAAYATTQPMNDEDFEDASIVVASLASLARGRAQAGQRSGVTEARQSKEALNEEL